MKILNEATLASFWEKQQYSSFGIITAFRGEYTRAINLQLNRELKNDILDRGLYIGSELIGVYKENYKTKEEREVKEQAFLVFPKKGKNDDIQNGLKKILMKLGEKYDQDSILYKSVYEDEAVLIGTTKRIDADPAYHAETILGKFRPKLIAEFYSRMRGRVFSFSDTNLKNTVLESLELYAPKSIDRRTEVKLCTFINENIDIEYTPKGYKHVISPIEKVRYSNQPKYSAYWLYANKIIPVPKLHIDNIIENPDKFGFSEEELREIYKQHNEPYGHEGKARVKIVTDLLNKGWIRVRYTPRNDLWVIELHHLSKITKDIIWSFFTLLTGNDIGNAKAIDNMNQFSDVRIHEIQNGETTAVHKTSVRDIISFTGLFEGCKFLESELVLIEDLILNNFQKTLFLLQK